MEKPFSSFGGEGAYFVGRFSVVLLIPETADTLNLNLGEVTNYFLV